MQLDAVGALGEAGHPVIEPDHAGIELRARAPPGCRAGRRDGAACRARRASARAPRTARSAGSPRRCRAGGTRRRPGCTPTRVMASSRPRCAQHVHGIGADLDAGADLAELRRLLVDLDLVAGLHQAGGGGEPAEAGAGDENSALLHSERRLAVPSCLGPHRDRQAAPRPAKAGWAALKAVKRLGYLRLVRSRGLEPPRLAALAPQASASTNSATTACGVDAGRAARRRGGGDVTNRGRPYKGELSGGWGVQRLDAGRLERPISARRASAAAIP